MYMPMVVRLLIFETVLGAKQGLEAPAGVGEAVAAGDFAARGINVVPVPSVPFGFSAKGRVLTEPHPAVVLENIDRAADLAGTDGQLLVRALRR